MGFFEILLIAVVTLLVVGPERMPETVRSVALTIGRCKRFFTDAKDEIEKQVGVDDVRRQLHNEAVMDQIAKTEADFEDQVSELVENSISPDDNNITPSEKESEASR